MIIKSISAENFGKFDRYSVNLDDNINVFFGDNEAGKTTLYEIISILLFAPQTEKEMIASNKLIKTDEKYARVYAIINMDGKEISIAREIYFNNTNLSIADQDNVSSLGNVNVPFIGDLSKEMYESFHTIDYYNMATITNNVWDQIIKVIEDSHGADRITPDYSTPEEEEIKKSNFEEDIKAKENEKSRLKKALKDAQKNQKHMIRNQDKIDDLFGELEDVENNIELETSYLKEAEKMNQIRSTIKKTQDLTLELEKYKKLKPWLPNLRKYYETLKLYSENVVNGIENPIDMFDDLEEKPAEEQEKNTSIEIKDIHHTDEDTSERIIEQKDQTEALIQADKQQSVKEEEQNADAGKSDEASLEEKAEVDEIEKVESYKYTKVTLPSENDYNLAREKINKFIQDNYLNNVTESKETTTVDVEDDKAEEIVKIPKASEHKKEEEDTIKEKIKPEIDIKQIRKVEVEPVVKEEELHNEQKEENKEEAEMKPEPEVSKAMQDVEQKIKRMLNKKSEDKIDIEPLEDIAPMDKFEPHSELEVKNQEESDQLPPDVKPLSIRKPRDMRNEGDDNRDDGYTNSFGQTNPYSDNIYPNMDDVNYSGSNLPKGSNDEDEKDKYSPSTSNDLPTQTQKVAEKDMNENKNEDPLIRAEEYLNNVDMKEIIAASKEIVEVDDETQDQIDKAQLRYKIIGKRVFEQDMDMDEITTQLKTLDTNAIYKTIVKYKGLSQKRRKAEHSVSKVEKQGSSNGASIALGLIAFLSMILGLACLFIKQLINFLPNVNVLNFIYQQVIMKLPLNNIIEGNILSGGAFVLIAILLTIALILGNDNENEFGGEQQEMDEVELEDLKNNIRLAKREVVDSLKGFPLPTSYLDNPNNSIITVINELREAEGAYRNLVHESTMPKNAEYRKMWELAKANLTEEEISEDLFDNISRLRRKIQDYKDEKQQKDKKLKDAKMGLNMFTSPDSSTSTGNENNFDSSYSNQQNDESPLREFGITPSSAHSEPQERSASETTSFSLPTTQSQEVNIPDYAQQSIEQVQEDNLFGNSQPVDTSYPSSDSYEPITDNSYPEGGGIFGGALKDSSYSGTDQEFGKIQDSGYPFNESDTSKDYNFPENEQNQNDSADDFGIPGIKKYTNDYQETTTEKTEDDPFGIPGIHRYGSDAGFQNQNAENDDPYGIPGIKKYTNDYPETNQEKTEDDFGIPGVNKYTSDIPTQSDSTVQEDKASDDSFGIPGIHRYPSTGNQNESQSIESSSFDIPGVNNYDNSETIQQDNDSTKDDFGIPGIKRYNPMEELQPENTSADSLVENQEQVTKQDKGFGGFPSGLPGMDKFSNRNEQKTEEYTPFKKVENAMPGEPTPESATDIVVEKAEETAVNAIDAAETVPFAGAVFSGGLPGLDKFSNRSEQTAKQEQQLEEPTIVEQLEVELAEPIESSVEQAIDSNTQTTDEAIGQINKDEEQQLPSESAETETPKLPEEIEEEFSNELESEAEIKEQTELESEQVKERQKDRREREYDELLELLGDDPEATIREVEQLTRDLHREITQRDAGMAELLKLNDAAVRLSTLSSNKWPYKQKAIDASIERIDYLEADKLKIGRHLKMLEEKIQTVEYEETPQAISDRIKQLDDEINQLKLENDKHALAEELIEKQKLLDMSSSDDRSHIIEDTSVYMKELTLGKYIEVKINEDQSGLSICDKDGQWFDTTKDRLSQATREQLYLALRISIADLFDEKSLIFPMFFDEALITWDKRRMKAVMRLLSKMSMHRQVIIFTCHDWLKDMISDYLIGAKIIMM